MNLARVLSTSVVLCFATVTATGVALQTFSMQASANLLEWNVLTNFTGNQSVTPFRFPFAPGDSNRFWRLQSY